MYLTLDKSGISFKSSDTKSFLVGVRESSDVNLSRIGVGRTFSLIVSFMTILGRSVFIALSLIVIVPLGGKAWKV